MKQSPFPPPRFAAQHVPYFEGPPPPRPSGRARRPRPARLAGAVGVGALVAAGAAVIATHADTPAAERPPRQLLRHTAVERFLTDVDGARAPVCNGGRDIPARVGRAVRCAGDGATWTVQITSVRDGVRYRLLP